MRIATYEAGSTTASKLEARQVRIELAPARNLPLGLEVGTGQKLVRSSYAFAC